MPVDVERRRGGACIQRLGPEEDLRSLRMFLRGNDPGGVDDPRIGMFIAVPVQGRLPVLFVDPVDHVDLTDRYRVRHGELRALPVEVPEELPGSSSDVRVLGPSRSQRLACEGDRGKDFARPGHRKGTLHDMEMTA